MKKCVVICCAILFAFSSYAQQREIIMPEESQKVNNIAEMDKGYWCSIELNGGATLMEGHKNITITSIEFSNGYRFNQWIKVGAGLGIMYYPNNKNVRNTKLHLALPLFLTARGNILSEATRRTVPYWSASIGSTIPDGFFFTPTLGLRFGEKRSAFLLGVSYTLRHLKTSSSLSNYSGAMLKLGYEF